MTLMAAIVTAGMVTLGLQGQSSPPAGAGAPGGQGGAEAGKPAAGAPVEMPPGRKLGLRAAAIRAQLPVIPVVVVVPDARSYVAAIEQWDFAARVRYPVLIDDGSWPARQAIARFVRAMKPKQVVRWQAPAEATWPAGRAERQSRLERVAARPWGVTVPVDAAADWSPAAALSSKWKELQFTPPGLVLSSADDAAWPAALALAAGRGQPLGWATGVGKPDGYMQPPDAAALARQTELLAEGTGLGWRGLGDELESVTLCLNCATKVFLGQADQRAMLALTDWIGRNAGEEVAKGPARERWAWAGQIIGSEWQSAYAAMCSMFLDATSAWMFDGYDSSPPWHLFDMTEAGKFFETGGLKVVVDDEENRSRGAWMRRASGGGVDAAMIFVNSSGNQDFFDLKPGQAKPADIPILRRPSMVHFVHSWSAAAPSDPTTVAGRWLTRGAFAYVGSVHEPYLQAFVPTPKLVVRLGAGMALGAAARLDNGEPWKLSVLGDPLWTLSRIGPVSEAALPLKDTVSLEDELSKAVKARDYAIALTSLLMLGRDEDAAALLGAVLRDDKSKLTLDGALAGLTSAFISGERDAFLGAFAAAQSKLGDEAAVRSGGLWDARDMLWHLLAPEMDTVKLDQAKLLGASLRAETLVRDTSDAFNAMTRTGGQEAAQALRNRAAERAAGETERRQIEQIGR